jgi:hypothetical protein
VRIEKVLLMHSQRSVYLPLMLVHIFSCFEYKISVVYFSSHHSFNICVEHFA